VLRLQHKPFHGLRAWAIGRRMSHVGQRGDTIVEVLIAITIVSLILGGAYVTTNHSLRDTRDGQERSTAVKIVETQIEQLHNLAITNPSAIFGATVPSSFCITNAGAVVASTIAACAVDSTGAPTTAEPVYHLAITQSSNTINSVKYTTFDIAANWTSVIGNGQDQMQMTYRLNQ